MPRNCVYNSLESFKKIFKYANACFLLYCGTDKCFIKKFIMVEKRILDFVCKIYSKDI